MRICAGFAQAPLAHPTSALSGCSVCSSSGVWPQWAVKGGLRHVAPLPSWSLVEFGQWEGPAENKRQEKRGGSQMSLAYALHYTICYYFLMAIASRRGGSPLPCLQLSLPGVISHHFRSLGSNGFLLLHQNSLLINVALECAVSYTFRWIYLQSWVMCIQKMSSLPKFLN